MHGNWIPGGIMHINLKITLLCLLLLNVVSCTSATVKDPTKQAHITEAYIYPEYRQSVAVAEEFSHRSLAKASGSGRAPASVP